MYSLMSTAVATSFCDTIIRMNVSLTMGIGRQIGVSALFSSTVNRRC